MVTQNHFVIPATVLEKFRYRGFPEGVTLTADHCIILDWEQKDLVFKISYLSWSTWQLATALPCTYRDASR